MSLDFKGLNASLTANAWNLLPEWLPGGTRKGKEYVCGSIQGGEGSSFSVNLESGVWKEFGNGDQVGGSDLISLWAAIQGLPQGEAFKQLSEKYDGVRPQAKRDVACPPSLTTAPPPPDSTPDMSGATATWTYRDMTGAPIYYVARYDTPANGKPAKKWFTPFSWDGHVWVKKAPLPPWPLYGLELLAANPGARVVLCEGEKTADAARKLLGESYLGICWPNGSSAWAKADYTPLHGRNLLLWPDNDAPGVKAMEGVANLLSPFCPEIKIVDVADFPKKDGKEGGSLDDCSTWNWTPERVIAWAKPRAKLWVKPPPAALPEPTLERPQYDPLKDWTQLVSKTDKGATICNAANVEIVLENDPEFKNSVWFDEFCQRPFTERNGVILPWADIYETKTMIGLQGKGFGLTRLTKTMVSDAVASVAYANRRNEPKTYFQSLVWDGTPRVASFFQSLMGSAQPEAYLSAVSKNFWVSMVARILSPGCKADHMVILVGEQGTLKSTALSLIAGKWFSELHNGFNSPEFYREIQGKLLIEVSELSSFKKSDVESIKGKLSATFDRGRDMYQKYHKDFQRQCIFAGTTNDDAFLKDTTGNRRFWPIAVGTIDLAAIEQQRDQLFAEAVTMYSSGANWHEVPTVETIAQQASYSEVHPWETIIESWLDDKHNATDGETTTIRVALDCLKIEKQNLSAYHTKIINHVLKKLGWASATRRDPILKKTLRVWKKD